MSHLIRTHRFSQLPAYQSQKQIIWQGFQEVPTPNGPIEAIYFGYRRQHVKKAASSGSRVDILEFKKLNADGTWLWSPFLIFSDDDFDGFADRLFIDSNTDGRIDNVHDVSKNQIDMKRVRFEPLLPLFKNFMSHQAA